MDREVRRLGYALLALFALLVAQTTRWQVVEANRLENNQANAFRRQVAEYRVDRGSIVADDGVTVLALSRKGPGDLKYARHYPDGPLYADVTGYYSLLFGPSELEQTFNPYLAASAPQLIPETLSDQILGRDKRGATIVTTIDPVVQRAACDAIANLPQGGAAVAMDPRTGDVLALCSNPTYDPNPLSSQDTKEIAKAWGALNRDPAKPLVPRADQELYPPGSTMKLVTAAAALQNGYGPESLWPNPSALTLPLTTHRLQNFGGEICPGGAQITLADALRISCNVVFGRVGLTLGAAKLAAEARAFGFAPDTTSGDVPFDVPFAEGVFPDPGYFAERPAAVAFSAIGQDNVAANPLQMALVASAIANGGREMRPRLVSQIRDPNGQILQTVEPQVYSTPLSPQNAATLTRMMVAVVDSGTGTLAQIPGVQVAGKTGTAQHGSSPTPHAWFTAFAPADNPQVAVAVIVLDGGSLGSDATGGKLAAPIARQVMEAALGLPTT